jgi:hypothetical protein
MIAMMRAALASACLVLATTSIHAEPRPRSHGLYAEAGIGARGFLGEAAESSKIGPVASLHIGYDLFSWLSVGGRVELSTHEATVPPPPEGEYYQLYSAGGEGRLGFSAGPMAFFADGAVGFTLISTNILSKVMILEPGEELTPFLSIGGGLEYQLQNRHYALGLAGGWHSLPAFDQTQGVSGRAYLRYTY